MREPSKPTVMQRGQPHSWFPESSKFQIEMGYHLLSLGVVSSDLPFLILPSLNEGGGIPECPSLLSLFSFALIKMSGPGSTPFGR